MTIRTRARFLIATATPMLVAVLTLAAPAAPLANDGSSATSRAVGGYWDVGFDPDDRTELGDRDIRRTSRRVYRTDRGRMLKIKVHTYEELGWYWWFDVHIDSRGGPRRDDVMSIVNADMNGNFCWVTRRGRESRHEGRFRQGGTWTSCRIEARLVHPEKRIRWRIVSMTIDEVRTPLDRAPDRGWYP